MPKDDMVYIGHMLDTAKEARSLIQGKDRNAFNTDPGPGCASYEIWLEFG